MSMAETGCGRKQKRGALWLARDVSGFWSA
jgi:hypothetical protein